MSRFYVGQRVRIVATAWHGFLPSPSGLEATIVEQSSVGGVTGNLFDWLVRLDCGRGICVDSHEIEPLVPPHEACDAEFKAVLDGLLERVEVAA